MKTRFVTIHLYTLHMPKTVSYTNSTEYVFEEGIKDSSRYPDPK
jgi:hypothetical protein